jgi:hypothetical protein
MGVAVAVATFGSRSIRVSISESQVDQAASESSGGSLADHEGVSFRLPQAAQTFSGMTLQLFQEPVIGSRSNFTIRNPNCTALLQLAATRTLRKQVNLCSVWPL